MTQEQKKLTAAVSISCFFTAFMGSSLNVAIPSLSAQYAVSPESITWVMAVFMIASSAFLLPVSALANRFGMLKIYLTGTIAAALSSLLVPLAPDFILLLIFRIIQGLSFALIFCTSMALLTDRIEPKLRGLAIGISVGCVYTGLSLAPLLGGFITDLWGWQVMFVITAAGDILSFFLVRHLPLDAPRTKRISLLKNVICFSAIAMILLALALIAEHLSALALLAAGIVLLIVFIGIERKAKHPLLPVNELRTNPLLSWSLGASAFNYMANFAISLLLAMHLMLTLKHSATFAGVFLMVSPLLQALSSPIAGRLTAYFKANYITLSGMILSLLAIVLLIGIDAATPLWFLLLAQAIGGCGFGLFSAPNTTTIMSSVPRNLYASAAALQAVTRNIGMACCMAILTALLSMLIDAKSGTALYAEELEQALKLSFSISAVLGALGVICCLLALKATFNRNA